MAITTASAQVKTRFTKDWCPKVKGSNVPGKRAIRRCSADHIFLYN